MLNVLHDNPYTGLNMLENADHVHTVKSVETITNYFEKLKLVYCEGVFRSEGVETRFESLRRSQLKCR